MTLKASVKRQLRNNGSEIEKLKKAQWCSNGGFILELLLFLDTLWLRQRKTVRPCCDAKQLLTVVRQETT